MTEQLLAILRRRANHEGLVMVREQVLVEVLDCDGEALRSGLAELARTGAIDLHTGPPFIVLKLRMWRGDGSKAAENTASAYSYSKQLLSKQHVKDSYRPKGIDPQERLLQEVLETLGEEDPSSFRKAIELYAPQVIRTALERVRRAKSIRKSRTALFRHLLPRIAKRSLPSS